MKERIAEAAFEEIAGHGLKFSMREIAGRLGISTKTVYQYFESKEQMIEYIVTQAIESFKEEEARLMSDASLSFERKLRRSLTCLPKGFAFRDVRIWKELQQKYPKQWKKLDEYMNDGWDNIRAMIREGIEAGAFRPVDDGVFVQVYVGGLYHFMSRGAADRRERSLESMLEQMADLLLAGICLYPEETASTGEDAQ